MTLLGWLETGQGAVFIPQIQANGTNQAFIPWFSVWVLGSVPPFLADVYGAFYLKTLWWSDPEEYFAFSSQLPLSLWHKLRKIVVSLQAPSWQVWPVKGLGVSCLGFWWVLRFCFSLSRTLLFQPGSHYCLLEIATLWPAEPHLGEKRPEECSGRPWSRTDPPQQYPLCRKMLRVIHVPDVVFAPRAPSCTQFPGCAFHTFQSHWSGAK